MKVASEVVAEISVDISFMSRDGLDGADRVEETDNEEDVDEKSLLGAA